jgi:hypothetical protein
MLAVDFMNRVKWLLSVGITFMEPVSNNFKAVKFEAENVTGSW